MTAPHRLPRLPAQVIVETIQAPVGAILLPLLQLNFQTQPLVIILLECSLHLVSIPHPHLQLFLQVMEDLLRQTSSRFSRLGWFCRWSLCGCYIVCRERERERERAGFASYTFWHNFVFRVAVLILYFIFRCLDIAKVLGHRFKLSEDIHS
jgi:hypothetical protein